MARLVDSLEGASKFMESLRAKACEPGAAAGFQDANEFGKGTIRCAPLQRETGPHPCRHSRRTRVLPQDRRTGDRYRGDRETTEHRVRKVQRDALGSGCECGETFEAEAGAATDIEEQPPLVDESVRVRHQREVPTDLPLH